MIDETLSLSEEFAAFIHESTTERIPGAVIDVLTEDLVDLVGCVLWGHETRWGRQVVEHVEALGQSGDSPVWGTALRLPASHAALALGTLGHAIDFDDYHPGAKVHPAAVVLPAVLSLASAVGASGAQVLRAGAVGFEVMIRLSLATGSVAGMLNGFHMTSICGGVGAAAGASVLLGLSPEATANALGLAATQAGGLMGFLHEGSDTKRLHAGRAAEVGIVSAQLAARGLTAAPHLLEMPHGGFMSAFSTDPQPSLAREDLGRRWHAADVSFKRFSCCGSIHSTLDAVADAVGANQVEVDSIEQIVVLQSEAVLAQCGWEYVPTDATHAQMSMQYCVAVFLIDGDVLPAQFRPDRLAAPDVLALARKVVVVADEEMDRLYPETFASTVRVHAGGQVLTSTCMSPRGGADNPLSQADIRQKFHRLSSRRTSPEQRASFLHAVAELPGAPDVERLTGALIGNPDTAAHNPMYS